MNDEQQARVAEAKRIARFHFPEFYRTGESFEKEALDGLVLAFAAFGCGVVSPRPTKDHELRRQLEQMTDASEKLYTELAQSVRACPTFAKIPAEERELMERDLLTVPKWWFGEG